jgi:hypothetical protein
MPVEPAANVNVCQQIKENRFFEKNTPDCHKTNFRGVFNADKGSLSLISDNLGEAIL